jgi:hypothetical protein
VRPSVRQVVTLVLVLLIEVYLYTRYAQLGAQFHFWLHGLLGAALGLAALTVLRLVTTWRRHRDPASGALAPWEAGWLGHLYSAVPDVLFLSFGVLHVLWMDVFAFHITLHFIPAPLLTVLALFLLALLAYGLAASRHLLTAATTLGIGVVILSVALALAAPLPGTIHDLRMDRGIALCPVAVHR